MNLDSLYSELTLKTDKKLVLLVLDGLGDLATKEQSYLTPLEAANTPNLDALSKNSAQGRMIPVAPGITPGSGPGHLGLFGYDPLEFQVGRGVIEALGLGVELKPGDVCARANFATLDAKGFLAEKVVVKQGANTTEFVYGKYDDWNNELNKIEAMYAGTIVERRNGVVVRDLTTVETETGQLYVVMPVPASVKKAGGK